MSEFQQIADQKFQEALMYRLGGLEFENLQLRATVEALRMELESAKAAVQERE